MIAMSMWLPAVRERFGFRRGGAATAERSQDLAHGTEVEIGEQPAQPFLRLIQVAIMAQPAQTASRQSRLIRIDLPRMQVEDRRPVLTRIDPANPPLCPSVREQPEIAAAADRKIHRAEPDRRPGRLDKRTGLAIQDVRLPGRYRNSVTIVVDREDAGVVLETFFDQDVERPQRARGNRVARCAVAEDARS